MRLGEILDRLEQLSPASFAMDWDNSGFLLGDRDAEIQRVLISVDVTKDVIKEAIEKRADLILAHHPMIFKPVSRIVKEDVIGEKILTLAQNHINVVCMHTNFDVIGMADEVADRLSLKHKKVLDVTFEDDIAKEGFGRTGLLPREMSLKELVNQVKLKFDIPGVIMYGDGDAIVEKVAICGGSGKDFIPNAIEAKCQVLITGDISYHAALDALQDGLFLIDAGHFGIEKIFIPFMRDFFEREIKQVTVICSEQKQIGMVL